MLRKELPSLIRFGLLTLLLVVARYADTYIEKTASRSYNAESGTETAVSENSIVVQATR